MFQVAVCDDDAVFREQIGKEVGKILFSRGEYEIAYYENGDEVRQAVEKKCFFSQLLLLDIHMQPLDGIEIADWLRKSKVDVDIIFITVSREHVYECYTYKAFAYLLKPVSIERLSSELNRYLDEIEESSEYLNITIRGAEQRIPLDRILYFESDIRKIRIHLPGDVVTYYGKMDELEELLKERGFLRCHQSYLVNTRYIRNIRRNEIELENMAVPVSRKYWEILRDREYAVSERIIR